MDEPTRLRMRRAHATRVLFCTCGKRVSGNGGRAVHSSMHNRKGDGHFYLVPDALESLRARGQYPPDGVPSKEYLRQIVEEDAAKRMAARKQP